MNYVYQIQVHCEQLTHYIEQQGAEIAEMRSTILEQKAQIERDYKLIYSYETLRLTNPTEKDAKRAEMLRRLFLED